ncbi:hypothetical protein A4A49_33781 [Nicotiana attenuata]|uniref:Uncharacterized protein n=1 Tax=Nicotiana attenuata TaxID=49451 RepID=A0A1J6I7D1_NICAT|nr:hypothetical protein A4A49_33781 [Nicotiana attenuata]
MTAGDRNDAGVAKSTVARATNAKNQATTALKTNADRVVALFEPNSAVVQGIRESDPKLKRNGLNNAMSNVGASGGQALVGQTGNEQAGKAKNPAAARGSAGMLEGPAAEQIMESGVNFAPGSTATLNDLNAADVGGISQDLKASKNYVCDRDSIGVLKALGDRQKTDRHTTVSRLETNFAHNAVGGRAIQLTNLSSKFSVGQDLHMLNKTNVAPDMEKNKFSEDIPATRALAIIYNAVSKATVVVLPENNMTAIKHDDEQQLEGSDALNKVTATGNSGEATVPLQTFANLETRSPRPASNFDNIAADASSTTTVASSSSVADHILVFLKGSFAFTKLRELHHPCTGGSSSTNMRTRRRRRAAAVQN